MKTLLELRTEKAELVEKMKQMDPQKFEDSVYRSMVFDLCPGCQQAMLANPLGR